MDNFILFFLSIIQGIVEIFPVSSFGHLVIVPQLLNNLFYKNNFTIDNGRYFVFLVFLHLSNCIGILWYYNKLIKQYLKFIFNKNYKNKNNENINNEDKFYLLRCAIIAAIPVCIIGYFLDHILVKKFGSYIFASIFLIFNGILLLLNDIFIKKQNNKIDNNYKKLNIVRSFKIGLWQSLGLIPGMSRSGMVILGLRLNSFDYSTSSYIGFFISIPVILGANLFKIVQYYKILSINDILFFTICCIVSSISSYITLKLINLLFKTHTMKVFGYYCVLFGVLSIALYFIKN